MTIKNFKNYLKNNYDIISFLYTKKNTLSLQQNQEITNVLIKHLNKEDIIYYNYYLPELNFLFHTFFDTLKIVLNKPAYEISHDYFHLNYGSTYYASKKLGNVYNKPIKFYLDLFIELNYRLSKKQCFEILENLKLAFCNTVLNEKLFNFIIHLLTQIYNEGKYNVNE